MSILGRSLVSVASHVAQPPVALSGAAREATARISDQAEIVRGVVLDQARQPASPVVASAELRLMQARQGFDLVSRGDGPRHVLTAHFESAHRHASTAIELLRDLHPDDKILKEGSAVLRHDYIELAGRHPNSTMTARLLAVVDGTLADIFTGRIT